MWKRLSSVKRGDIILFFLPRQQGWHGNCQPLLAGVLTPKPNNGSAMLASVTVFGSGRKVVTRCRQQGGSRGWGRLAGMVVGTRTLTRSLCPRSSVARQGGFQVCPFFVGHGIGSYFHGHPEVWHHGKRPPPAGPVSPLRPAMRAPRGGEREGGEAGRAPHTHTSTPPRTLPLRRGGGTPLGRVNRWEAGGHPQPRFPGVAGVFLRTSRSSTELSGQPSAASPARPGARARTAPEKFVTGQRKISAKTLKFPAWTEPPSG